MPTCSDCALATDLIEGHARVALESWPKEGDFVSKESIETTELGVARARLHGERESLNRALAQDNSACAPPLCSLLGKVGSGAS